MVGPASVARLCWFASFELRSNLGVNSWAGLRRKPTNPVGRAAADKRGTITAFVTRDRHHHHHHAFTGGGAAAAHGRGEAMPGE